MPRSTGSQPGVDQVCDEPFAEPDMEVTIKSCVTTAGNIPAQMTRAHLCPTSAAARAAQRVPTSTPAMSRLDLLRYQRSQAAVYG